MTELNLTNDESSELGLFVIRNRYNEYLWVGVDEDQEWVDYDQASWLEESDAEWYNEGQWEIVAAI